MMTQAAAGGTATGASGAGAAGGQAAAGAAAMGGFPMMQNPMAPGMPGALPVAGGTDQAASAQNQQQFMAMPGFVPAMPMMYPGNVAGAQGQLNQQPNAGGAFRNKNNDS